MKRQRERDGKKNIQTWGKMKKELKRKYLPFNYYQDIYLKIQNFKQRDLSVEEYSAKFVNLIIKGDLQEAEEICIADAGASINTPNIGNSTLIIEELDWGGQDALNTCETPFLDLI